MRVSRDKNNYESQSQKLTEQLGVMQNLIHTNEKNRKVFSNELKRHKMENEKFKNQVIELKHKNSLVKMEVDILGDRLKVLNESIQSLGNAKEV